MFCPKCGCILRPTDKGGKRVLACGCGYVAGKSENFNLKEKGTENKKIEVVDSKIIALPRIEAVCPKCEHKKAYYWTKQTRAADEPETRFFKCEKCEHTWREYS